MHWALHADDTSLGSIRQLYETRQYADAITQLNSFLQSNPRNFQARKLLYEVYFASDLLTKAETELNELLSFSKSEENLLLAARFYFYTLQFDRVKSLTDQIIKENSRHVPALILQAKLIEHAGHHAKARSVFRSAELSESGNQELLMELCQFMLRRYPDQAKPYLEKFGQLYPESPDYLYTKALFLFREKGYQESLSLIRRALFYNPHSRTYIKLLADIYLAQRNLDGFVRLLEETDSPLKAENRNYLIAYYNEINFKPMNKPGITAINDFNSWKVPDVKYLEHRINKYLDLSIDYAEDTEPARYYRSALLKANYPIGSKNRIEDSRQYFLQSSVAKAGGELDKYTWNLFNALRLDPQNADYRRDLVEYYLTQKYTNSAIENLKIIQSLLPEKDWRIDARIEKMNRETALHIHRMYGLDPLDIDRSYTPAILFNTDIHFSSSFTPNASRVLSSMLAEILETADHYRMQYTNGQVSAQTIKTSGADYYLTLHGRQDRLFVSIEARLSAASNGLPVFNKPYVTSGNYSFFDVCWRIMKDVNSIIPLRGKIEKISGNTLIVALGTRHSAVKDGTLAVDRQVPDGGKINRFIVTAVEEYYSKAEPVGTAVMRYVNPGDAVVYSPPAADGTNK